MKLRFALFPAVLSMPLAVQAQTLRNPDYSVRLNAAGEAEIRARDGATAVFAARFFVARSPKDPDLEMLWGRFQDPGLRTNDSGSNYNVLTWGEKLTTATASGHVADGFDPRSDRSYGPGRTADVFSAAPGSVVSSSAARPEGNRFIWSFPEAGGVRLSAEMELPSEGAPVLRLHATVPSAAWYSFGYVGAPEAPAREVAQLWQPLIYNERRFPEQSFLEAAYRCPLPGTLVTAHGATLGVFADPGEYPFQPMPNEQNSRFGVALRNREGRAEPMLFAPILGGAGSHLTAGESFDFRYRLVVSGGGLSAAYETVARRMYGFADVRHNALGSLNRAFENMVEFGLSDYARFNPELRGFAYDTDVPGSVKNISALQPLSVALVTDDRQIYARLARPIIEYFLSRGRYLFTVNPKVTGQGASSRLDGLGSTISEFSSLYEMSGRRSPVLLEAARSLYGRTRSLNLDAPTTGRFWADALALYEATSDRTWLHLATQGADEYIERRVDREQTDFDDPNSGGFFFWTGFTPRWMQLCELFEATHEGRYLAAAHRGAREYAQFVWLSPRIPEGDILVNRGGIAPAYRTGPRYPRIHLPEEIVPAWRVSEIGLTCEAAPTSKGARGILLACYAPWMLRIAALTGDRFLHDIARSAVIGRYTSFPGYHMNTARTTVYEKPDFARRPMNELNSTTSLHYNHIWPMIGLVQNYLVADAFVKSGGRIDFPDRYAEGYGYVQEQVYGDRPGRFYDTAGLYLWMPRGLADPGNPELNYIAARGPDCVALAFTNQSKSAVRSVLSLDRSRLLWPAGSRPEIAVWKNNTFQGSHPFADDGREPIEVAAEGITAVVIRGVSARTAFQDEVLGSAPALPAGSICDLGFRGARAAAIRFGSDDLTSVYIYLPDFGREVAQCTLRYRQGGGDFAALTRDRFPFDFTAPAQGDERMDFYLELRMKDGRSERSPTGTVLLH